MRRAGAFLILCLLAGLSWAAVQNGQLTVLWDVPPVDVDAVYELRWSHFAQPSWVDLPPVPASAGHVIVTFAPLPPTPPTDRWLCVDARQVSPTTGPWLSETKEGPACNVVEVGTIVLPPPPPPTPPSEPPPSEIFSNVRTSKGQLAVDYLVADCPRGVQQAIGALKNGSRTITLICRR